MLSFFRPGNKKLSFCCLDFQHIRISLTIAKEIYFISIYYIFTLTDAWVLCTENLANTLRFRTEKSDSGYVELYFF
jgi:hypothetical protein